MAVPTTRLLVVSALLVVPCATLAGVAAGPGAYAALALFAVVCLTDAVLGRQRLRALGVSVPAMVRLTRDIPANLPLRLENRGSRNIAMRVGLTLPDGVASDTILKALELPPGAYSLDWPCRGVERGEHLLRQAHLEAASPLRLWSARGAFAVQCALRVYPNLRDRATAALFLRGRGAGVQRQRQVGKGREFEKLREYSSGDSYEDVHWKSTAKRGFPVVKLYQIEHSQEVYAVIDSSRLSAREGLLEHYVQAALHLALAAERQGDRFGLITFSHRPQRFVRARKGMAHFRLCREAIYNLHAQRVSPNFAQVFSAIATNLTRRSLLIFFTSLDDALLAETFEREIAVLSRRHVVLVNVLRTAGVAPLFSRPAPDAPEALYEHLAGQLVWNRLLQLRLSLAHRGVRLSLVDPAEVKPRVTASYLDIKRRQLL